MFPACLSWLSFPLSQVSRLEVQISMAEWGWRLVFGGPVKGDYNLELRMRCGMALLYKLSAKWDLLERFCLLWCDLWTSN